MADEPAFSVQPSDEFIDAPAMPSAPLPDHVAAVTGLWTSCFAVTVLQKLRREMNATESDALRRATFPSAWTSLAKHRGCRSVKLCAELARQVGVTTSLEEALPH